MEYIVGTALALLFCGAAAGLGMDRERVFWFCMTFDVTAAAFVALAMLARARGEPALKSFGPCRARAPSDQGRRST
ncbi:hypothetical protein AWB81_05325 [Caballeronia arationis]|uniref:hypothetical protein n=1 Tax=Caballeronia arationis TaxID=1777142 RepID=UPI00074CC395|nr:hypothetical protein [Caballeronia arationis]SAK95865.1 hypothetical protein AWB81_05325 [Caballeronia arationis]